MAITALIVPVPEAEPLVHPLRLRFDATTALGVPAHITTLVPFMAPDLVTEEVLHRLSTLCAAVGRFDYTLARVGRWPQTTYLAPAPAQPFVRLTEAVVAAFPGFAPYGGAHPEIVPHLTVADGSAESADDCERALRRQTADLPIRCVARWVELIENASGRWRRLQRFDLGP
jgi:hypothetical protein